MVRKGVNKRGMGQMSCRETGDDWLDELDDDEV
jgi:hypothetical protein